MNTHKNARLTFARRIELVRDMTDSGLSPAAAGARAVKLVLEHLRHVERNLDLSIEERAAVDLEAVLA